MMTTVMKFHAKMRSTTNPPAILAARPAAFLPPVHPE
jgi:hypothetical protein